jgi:hypothetical protein
MLDAGIFWLIDNKLAADSICGRRLMFNGGFLWTTLQRLMPQWKGKECTDFPRGRVLFDSMEEVFLVFSSRGIVNSPDLKNMILAEFNLPSAATKFAADYHCENAIPPVLDEGFDGTHA